jgi:hypothetical protein
MWCHCLLFNIITGRNCHSSKKLQVLSKKVIVTTYLYINALQIARRKIDLQCSRQRETTAQQMWCLSRNCCWHRGFHHLLVSHKNIACFTSYIWLELCYRVRLCIFFGWITQYNKQTHDIWHYIKKRLCIYFNK